MEIVAPHDETCDVCAGRKNRPRPKPGERWSAREMVRRICRACYAEFVQDAGTKRDPERELPRRKLQLPDDPAQT